VHTIEFEWMYAVLNYDSQISQAGQRIFTTGIILEIYNKLMKDFYNLLELSTEFLACNFEPGVHICGLVCIYALMSCKNVHFC
jgi:hypothetical protein